MADEEPNRQLSWLKPVRWKALNEVACRVLGQGHQVYQALRNAHDEAAKLAAIVLVRQLPSQVRDTVFATAKSQIENETAIYQMAGIPFPNPDENIH